HSCNSRPQAFVPAKRTSPSRPRGSPPAAFLKVFALARQLAPLPCQLRKVRAHPVAASHCGHVLAIPSPLEEVFRLGAHAQRLSPPPTAPSNGSSRPIFFRPERPASREQKSHRAGWSAPRDRACCKARGQSPPPRGRLRRGCIDRFCPAQVWGLAEVDPSCKCLFEAGAIPAGAMPPGQRSRVTPAQRTTCRAQRPSDRRTHCAPCP